MTDQNHPLGDAQGWQDIATAPRDGSRILLFQRGRGAFEGWWKTEFPHAGEYWMDDQDSEPEPTHWQPRLPDPGAAQPPAAPVETDSALVSELADVAENHFLPTIEAMRAALLIARKAIWSGGDTIRAITAIDAALAHPGSPARTAPESCPNCINEDDCASVDICRAVEEVNSPQRSSAETGGPTVIDFDDGEISVRLNGKELRGWSYSNADERRTKMLAAREYVEGWCDGRDAR